MSNIPRVISPPSDSRGDGCGDGDGRIVGTGYDGGGARDADDSEDSDDDDDLDYLLDDPGASRLLSI